MSADIGGRSRILWCLVLIQIALFQLATIRQVYAVPSDASVWWHVESEHFEILSNASEQRTLATARDLDALHRAISQVTLLSPLSPVPTKIYLFRDDAALVPYKHLYRGEPASMSGASYSQPYGDYISVNGQQRVEARVTVYHESMHVVVRNNLPDIPLWLEEGLAELFSTLGVTDGKAQIGRGVPWHLKSLSRGERAPLRDILSATADSEIYNRFEHQGEFYARAWELTHFLLLGNAQRRQQAMGFITAQARGDNLDKAFYRAFGVTLEAFEKELSAYRAKGFATTLVPLPSRSKLPIKRERPSYPEVLYHLGELLVSQGGRDAEAGVHFEEALRRDPNFGKAYVGLGLLAESQGDLPRARAHYQKAVTMAPLDPRGRFLYGASLMVLGRATSAAKVAEAHKHLKLAITLDPSFAPAWLKLEQTRRLTGDTKYEVAFEPSTDVALRQMLLHSRSRQLKGAETLWREAFAALPPTPTREAAHHVLDRLRWRVNGKNPPDLVRALNRPATSELQLEKPAETRSKVPPG